MKKLSVKQFTIKKSNDRCDTYPQYQYICMDDANKVAFSTDNQVLFVNPSEYVKYPYDYINKTMAERQYLVVDTDGNLKEYTFPNWQEIIPPVDDRKPIEFLSECDIKNAIQEADAFCKWKVNTRFKKNNTVIYFGNDIWLSLDKAKKMMRAGFDNWFYKSGYKSILYKQWDGKTMVVISNENIHDTPYIDDYKQLGFANKLIYKDDLIKLYKLYKKANIVK